MLQRYSIMCDGALLVLLLCALALLAYPVHGKDKVDEKDVVVLTSDFKNEVEAHEFMLVEFYAPWCGHCKQLKPQYAKAATLLKESEITNVRLAKIDCEKVKNICDKNGVQGYPTIKLFRRGLEPIDFQGQRTADGIVEFVTRYSGQALTDLATKEDTEKLQKSSGVVIIAYTSDGALRKIVEEAAESLRAEAKFGIASSKLSPTGSASLYAYLDFADGPVAFEGEFSTVDDVTKFVQRESFPLVQEITPENYKRYLHRNLPLLWAFLEKDQREANIEILHAAAVESKGKLSWVYLDATDYGRHAQTMGLSANYPGVAIDDHISKKRYLYPDDAKFEIEALRDWVGKVLAGEIKAFPQSETIPENNDGPLVQIVGNNYDDIVLDESKDVLLEVYSPSCASCIELEPEYKALSNIFKDDSSVIIAKADGTANDLPIEINGFPSIFLFPADEKEKPIVYDGDGSAEALVAFVVKHSNMLSEERKIAILASKEARATYKDEL